MKTQNKNNFRKILNMKVNNKLFFGVIFVFIAGIAKVFADNIEIAIDYQTSTGFGSSHSVISFSRGTPTYYVNKGDNSTAIGNYFKGYYYDSTLGYFLLDWSTDTSQNVRIIDSTSKCSSGYGYKLGGYSYSNYFGFVDFDYDSNIYVYYCLADNKLHGLAYSKYNGFQNFEGISLDLFPTVSTAFVNPSSEIFVNDVTSINDIEGYVGSGTNKDDNSVGGERYNLDDTKEATFYIIK